MTTHGNGSHVERVRSSSRLVHELQDIFAQHYFESLDLFFQPKLKKKKKKLTN